MSHYIDKKVESTHERVVESKIVEKSAGIDVEELAQAVAKAMGGNRNYGSGNSNDSTSNFDNSKTLEQLAKSMTVQRGGGESNFKDLGNTVETKKDKSESDSTIDFLKGMD